MENQRYESLKKNQENGFENQQDRFQNVKLKNCHLKWGKIKNNFLKKGCSLEKLNAKRIYEHK